MNEITKQHYARIAAVLAEIKPLCLEDAGREWARRYLARQLAEALEGTNPNYDAERFLKACEIDTEGP